MAGMSEEEFEVLSPPNVIYSKPEYKDFSFRGILTRREIKGFKFEVQTQKVLYKYGLSFEGNPINVEDWKRSIGEGVDINVLYKSLRFNIECKYLESIAYPSYVKRDYIPRFRGLKGLKLIVTNNKWKLTYNARQLLKENNIILLNDWELCSFIFNYYKKLLNRNKYFCYSSTYCNNNFSLKASSSSNSSFETKNYSKNTILENKNSREYGRSSKSGTNCLNFKKNEYSKEDNIENWYWSWIAQNINNYDYEMIFEFCMECGNMTFKEIAIKLLKHGYKLGDWTPPVGWVTRVLLIDGFVKGYLEILSKTLTIPSCKYCTRFKKCRIMNGVKRLKCLKKRVFLHKKYEENYNNEDREYSITLFNASFSEEDFKEFWNLINKGKFKDLIRPYNNGEDLLKYMGDG